MNKIKINNSCRGNRGCSIERIILPYGIKFINFSNEVYGNRNDIQKILPFSYLSLDKMVA